MGFSLNFSVADAMATFLSRKISRYTEAFLDSIGEEKLIQFIQSGEKLTDYVPDEQKMQLKVMCMPYMRIVNDLTPEQVYNSFPAKYKTFFETTPNGAAWVLTQLVNIKQILTS